MPDYPSFPLFISLEGKKIVVIGGGRIAARRIRTLTEFTPCVTVVAPETDASLLPLEEAGRVHLLRKPFSPEDVEGAFLVLAAADASVNEEVRRVCRDRGIPVNVSSDRRECDFYFPGIARRGDLVAGVTASGRDHAGARKLTEAIRDLLEDFES